MGDCNYRVLVRCLTYNHVSYIEDAMNGFCMQKTTFPFVCAIIDDASTDGEQEVIKMYLANHFDLKNDKVARNEETNDYYLTFAQHKTNKNCHFIVLLLKYNHYQIGKAKFPYIREWTNNSKYYAVCEGDDYWTVSDKLQRQVDFLENHSDYSMCFHGAIIKCESGFYSENRKHQFDGLETREYKGEELIKKWIIPTASMVYRSSIVLPRDARFLVGDLVLRNQCIVEGRVFCFSEPMSVYRLNDGGMTKKRPWDDLEKHVNHTEAVIEHFPQFKSFYMHSLCKVIRKSLFTRKGYETLLLLIKKPRTIKYLFGGMFYKENSSK